VDLEGVGIGLEGGSERSRRSVAHSEAQREEGQVSPKRGDARIQRGNKGRDGQIR